MTLGQMIERLAKEPQDKTLRLGFAEPHSYRGYYECLAVEPRQHVKVADMLACLCSVLGTEQPGYKGGMFLMHEHVDVYLAHYGSTGEELGPRLLGYMLADVED